MINNSPAFEVYPGADVNLTDNTNHVLTFDNEVYDTDSAYNTSDGIFTCPTAKGGKYLTWCSLGIFPGDVDSTQIAVAFLIDGSVVADFGWWHADSAHTAFQYNCIQTFNVAAGEECKLYVYANASDNVTGKIEQGTLRSKWGMMRVAS
jgi:hypothetical protein